MTTPTRGRRAGAGIGTLVVLAALAALVAACGPPPTSADTLIIEEGAQLPDCPVDALDDATGPVDIDVWHGLSAESQRALEDMGQRFNQSQDEVKVNIRKQGASYDEVLRKYTSATTSGQAPAVVYIEDISRQVVVDSGQVFPMESCYEADDVDLEAIYPEAVRTYYRTNGFFFPGYVNVSEPILYYNGNHFRRAGLDPDDPPETLEELREAAETIKAEAGVPRPFSLRLTTWFFTSWMVGVGHDVVNANNGLDGVPTKSDLASEVPVETVQFLKDMADDGLLEPYSSTDGQINQYLSLAQQQSTMTVETSTAATTVAAFVGGELPEAGEFDGGGEVDTSSFDPRSAPYPGIEAPGGARVSGGAFYVSSSVDPAEQLAGWRFLKFMLEEENQLEWYTRGSYLPVASGLPDSPEVQEFAETTLAGNLIQAGIDMFDSIDPEAPGPAMGPYDVYFNAVDDALDRVFFEGADVQEALQQAQDELDEALAAYE